MDMKEKEWKQHEAREKRKMSKQEALEDAQARMLNKELPADHPGNKRRLEALKAVTEVAGYFDNYIIRRSRESKDDANEPVLPLPDFQSYPIWICLEEREQDTINSAKGLAKERYVANRRKRCQSY